MDDGTLFRQKSPAFMQQLMESFRLQDIHAAAIMGNIGYECEGLTIFHERGQPVDRGGYGWAQWTGPRREAFLDWCDENRWGYTDDIANYGYLEFELRTSQSDAIAALLKTSTLESAVVAFERNFERAGITNYPKRIDWANIALAAFKALTAPNPAYYRGVDDVANPAYYRGVDDAANPP